MSVTSAPAPYRMQVIHRDLTPANILLSEEGTVKLCDFGLARTLRPSSDTAEYTQYVVTRWYRPPELLVGGVYGTPVGRCIATGPRSMHVFFVFRYSSASHIAFNRTADVWAIGCLFCEIVTGRPLFPGRDTLDQLWLTMRSVGPLPLWQMQLMEQDFHSDLAKFRIPAPSEMRPLDRRLAIVHAIGCDYVLLWDLFRFGTCCRLTHVKM